MGAVAIDVNKGERQLEVKFPMHTVEGVVTFLENIHYTLGSIYYAGDIDALIMMIDFETALAESKLTDSEFDILYRVYFQDMKRVDVAKELGVAKQTVQKKLQRAIGKIALYYAEMEGVESEI